jgi:hypothetical protein
VQEARKHLSLSHIVNYITSHVLVFLAFDCGRSPLSTDSDDKQVADSQGVGICFKKKGNYKRRKKIPQLAISSYAAELRININFDGAPITSQSHTP